MKDEPMPKTIQDALSQDSTKSINEVDEEDQYVRGWRGPDLKMFTRDFDTKSNRLSYLVPIVTVTQPPL
ncbi:hypothetical protein Hanom_Chr07g00623101 [Helianthus anomalus]